MKKSDKIIYWVSTVWLCLGMASTGIVQLIQLEEEAKKMSDLGFPLYFLPLIGIWKLLGVMAVLLPRFPLVKEWAYAGFFFLMTGAVVSHLAHHDPFAELFGPTLLLVLTAVSWYFRPASRRVTSTLTLDNA
ncbi:DoxX family protein [Rufibacter roseus]|uniref:DoxX family protein n=1 Tax=Rufibacter roseus TaxID=1567108 RepID=A0ABW2DPJ1_9BACT|nr:DoxX family protein [Rufibacter roseus]